jgi:Late exocytosis, associated with Golgi transport/Cytosolic domain of 10TM putative phosphate transporter
MEAPVPSVPVWFDVLRFLQEAQKESSESNTTTIAVDSNTTIVVNVLSDYRGRDGKVLQSTFSVYGSIMLIALLLFCYLRRRFPRPFQVRDWVEEHKTYLASNQYGWFSWIWEHNHISEDEILRECGLDSLCFLRLLIMGFKVASFCAVQSIWLIPLYRYARSRDDPGFIDDRVGQLTMGHVPPGSPKLIGTVIAAYFIFLYVMYLIYKEFDWFIAKRHRYLVLPQASNYTVHVRNVPLEIRTNAKLTQYFRKCLSDTAVHESRLRIKTPQLQAALLKRDAIVSKFEHALNYETVKGETPKHREYKLLSRDFQLVDSVPTYAAQLRTCNLDITKRITAIEEENFDNDMSNESFLSCDLDIDEDERGAPMGSDFQHQETTEGTTTEGTSNGDYSTDQTKATNRITGMFGQGADLVANTAKSGVGILTKTTKTGVGLIANTAGTVAKTAATAILGASDDGEYLAAGFVSFNTLRQKNAALQMLHHSQPFSIEVLEAPEPDDSKFRMLLFVNVRF